MYHVHNNTIYNAVILCIHTWSNDLDGFTGYSIVFYFYGVIELSIALNCLSVLNVLVKKTLSRQQ